MFRKIRLHVMVLVGAMVLFGSAVVEVRGAAQDYLVNTPAGKRVKKELLQTALRTVGKQTLRKALVLKEVYDVTYSATRAVINAPQYYRAGQVLIQGVMNDQCWAIAGTEIECRGLELDPDLGQNVADAELAHSCRLHGSSASAHTRVVRGTGDPATDFISIVGHAKTWWGSADWVGLGGVGDNMRIDSSVLNMVARIQSLILDPVYQPNQSWLDSDLTPSEQVEDLSTLFEPSGFALSLRVFYPQEIAGRTDALYYDAQIIGMLSLMDIDAEDPASCFGVELIMDGLYFDPAGNVADTVTDQQVCNLTADLFTYSEGETSVAMDPDDPGWVETQPFFQFGLEDYDLSLPVAIPGDWGDYYAHVDFEVMAGSSAVPEPGVFSVLLTGAMLALGVGKRRRGALSSE